MKTLFRTNIESADFETAVVEWCRGWRKFGRLVIDLSQESIRDREDLGPIAEMMAIRHLLWDEETSDERFSIRAVELEVASPSIIDVLDKTSERKNQERYASLLRTAFLGVDIWAREEPVSSIIPTLEEFTEMFPGKESHYDISIQKVAITPDMRSPYMACYAGTMKVLVSEHAVKMFVKEHQDNENSTPSSPYKSIRKSLQHPELALYELPEKAQREKEEKYGEHGVAEIWRHDRADMMYMMLPRGEPNSRVLLSCSMGSKGYLKAQRFVRFRDDV